MGQWARLSPRRSNLPVSLLAGRLPPRVLAPIVEWASRYQAELLANWVRCEHKEPLTRIPPLE